MEEFKKLTEEDLEKVTGGACNWSCFGACLLSHGASAIPALAEIVFAINAKDWTRVSQLSNLAAIANLPIVSECKASCVND